MIRDFPRDGDEFYEPDNQLNKRSKDDGDDSDRTYTMTMLRVIHSDDDDDSTTGNGSSETGDVAFSQLTGDNCKKCGLGVYSQVDSSN